MRGWLTGVRSKLLQASPSRLTPREQAELQEFIRDQVRLARLDAAEQETTLAQLGKALDYRRWHCFKLSKRNAARGLEARELTRHEHDSGSGGEKAISLHLPLLAAAASYPASGQPDALRMVMLDEAFTRIDDEGRRGIMGLISKFDLDVMLTSPDFWGCYEDVPALIIYALAPHDERFPGVVARRFHWDGERRAPGGRRAGCSRGGERAAGAAARMTGDTEAYLQAPAFARLWQAARDAYERNGGIAGTAFVRGLSEDEAAALNGLLRRRRPLRASGQLKLGLQALDETLREFACPLEEVLISRGGASRTGPRSASGGAARTSPVGRTRIRGCGCRRPARRGRRRSARQRAAEATRSRL